MPTFEDEFASPPLRILAVGDSGNGKTGSLVSLLLAGFKIKVADFDRGVPIVKGMGQNHPDWNKVKANFEFETFTNEYEWKGEAPKPVPGQKMTDIKRSKPKTFDAWHRGLRKISEWTACGRDTFLVIDSLTAVSDRCMENIQALTGRLGQQPVVADYGAAIDDMENFLNLMSSDAVGCHTIMFAHKTYVEGEGGVPTPYPRALGQKLPPRIPTYFNTMIGYRSTGSGEGTRREIVTTPDRGLAFKSESPSTTKSVYVLDPKKPESGLIDLVRDLGVEPPK